jgi:hypothetical protein
MIAGVIGVVIGLLLGGFAGFMFGWNVGWENGWDDCKKFVYTELDKRDDKTIVPLVRMMAENLRGGEDGKNP